MDEKELERINKALSVISVSIYDDNNNIRNFTDVVLDIKNSLDSVDKIAEEFDGEIELKSRLKEVARKGREIVLNTLGLNKK